MIVRGRGMGQTEVPPGCTETPNGVICSGPSGPTGGGTGINPVQPIFQPLTPAGPVDCTNAWQFLTNPSTCWSLPNLPNCNTFLGTGAAGQMLCGGNAYWIWLGMAAIGVLILYGVYKR